MNNPFYQKSIISLNQFDKKDIDFLLDQTTLYKQGKGNYLSLKNKTISICFFEPSTRTRLSFESAALKLGGNIIGFADSGTTSLQGKGESLYDTFKVMSEYSDALIIRHSKEGAARLAAEVTKTPVINAGDGANQHPTQTLLDLFTIKETQGRIEKLHIALVGDLKHARTIHSLVQAASLYDIRLYFVSPAGLNLPETLTLGLKRKGVKFSFHQSIKDIIENIDILYMTRLQRERFEKNSVMEKAFLDLVLQPSDLKGAKSNLKILHPLPRCEELPSSIDETPYAYYFEQAKNGLFLRQALLHLMMNQEEIK